MVYIFESELSKNKSIFFALTRVYGIGNSTAHSICHKLGFSKNLKVKHLSISQTQELVLKIEALNLLLTSDLKKFKFLKRKSLITNKSY